MRVASLLLGAILATVLLAPASASEASFETYGQPALEAINTAFQAGQITEAQALLYRVYFVKDWDKLPAQFQIRGGSMTCATAVLVDVYNRVREMPASAEVDEIIMSRSRPYLPLTRVTAHFIVHYALTGPDAAPSEAYVDVIESACEAGWTQLHSAMTWEAPPGDGGLGGGNNMIDCYVHSMDPGLGGYAEYENPVPGDPPYDYTGYFHVSTALPSGAERACVAVHEYTHVVEFGYIPANTWYMENCAMMAEEWTYDSYNTYEGYLQSCLGFPYKSIKTFNGQFEYGGIVWPMYKVQRFGDVNIPERIWDYTQWNGANSIWNAFDNELAPYGYDINSAVAEYRRWCFYTRDRDDGQHYEEAGEWTAFQFPDKTLDIFPTGEQHPTTSPVDKRPEPLGSSIMAFEPPVGAESVLRVTLDGVDLYTSACQLIRKAAGVNVWFEYFMTVDPANGQGTIDIPGFDQSDYVWMYTSVAYAPGGPRDYRFWGENVPGSGSVTDPINSGDLVRIWPCRPNPMADNAKVAYTLAVGGSVDVSIVDVGGRTVKNLYSSDLHAGNYEVMWNGTDNGGQRVASGVYYAVVRFNGQEMTRQVTVLR